MFLLRRLLLLLCASLSTVCHALPTDAGQTMHITANSTSFNYKKGTGIYEGNVIVTQGKTRLEADRLITRNNLQHKIQQVLAYGLKQRAHYMTYLSETDTLQLNAEAEIIRFYPFRSLVVLEGNASVRHGEDLFEGPVAIYDMKNQTVNAPHSKNGRSKILIQPDREAL